MSAGGQHPAPVKGADIIQPEKAALEYVMPLGVFPVDPPCEIEKLLENPLEEDNVNFLSFGWYVFNVAA
jgi:hypothetical protein